MQNIKKTSFILIGFTAMIFAIAYQSGECNIGQACLQISADEISYDFPPEVTERSAQVLVTKKQELEKNPNSFTLQNEVAHLLVSLARKTGSISFYQMAEQLALKSIELSPRENLAAHLILVKIKMAQHQFKEALELLKLYSENHLEVMALKILTLHSLGESIQANVLADRMLEKYPTAQAYNLKAQSLEGSGDLRSAFNFFKLALKNEDVGQVWQSAWTRAMMAKILLQNGQEQTAEKLLQEALRLEPKMAFAKELMAQVEIQKGNLEKAFSWANNAFSETLQLPYLISMGEVRALQGKPEAQEILRMAEKMAQEEVDAGFYGHRLQLAKILSLLGEKQKALELVEAEEKARPSHLVKKYKAQVLSQSWAL